LLITNYHYSYDSAKNKLRTKSLNEITKVLEPCAVATAEAMTIAVRQLLFQSGKKGFTLPSDLTTEFPPILITATSTPSTESVSLADEPALPAAEQGGPSSCRGSGPPLSSSITKKPSNKRSIVDIVDSDDEENDESYVPDGGSDNDEEEEELSKTRRRRRRRRKRRK
jgi:hypothetical protein